MFTFSWSLTPDPAPTGTAPTITADQGRDLAVDDDGNLVVVDGDLMLVGGVESIASDIKSRLQTFAGEYFLDITAGVSWLEPSADFPAVLGEKYRPNLIAQQIRARVQEAGGVLPDGVSVSTGIEGRALTIDLDARTDFGLITASLTTTES